MHHGSGNGPAVRDHLRILRRRKWVILLCALLVPAAAVLFSLTQRRLYEASAEVLLSRQNLVASLTGTPDPSAYQQADRVAQTQAELAQVPEVAARVLEAVGLPDRPEDFLNASRVSAKSNADLLEFRVTDATPALAVRLASEYARQYTLYRLELDTGALEQARTEVESRIAQLEAAGEQDSSLYASLAEKEQQLRTMEALQTSNAFVVRPADKAVLVRPKPIRNGLLGLLLGLALGVGLALAREALDTRVRSADEIGEMLGLPLLARLPEPPRRLRGGNGLVMFAEPTSVHAEAFRMLRTNLDFVNLERGARMIMVTSSVEGEGKSTTAANLAIALARAGRRVILADLDLRRPSIDRFFGLKGRPGLTDVALGHVRLEQAIVPMAIAKPTRTGIPAGGNGNGNGGTRYVLEVLPSGPNPPDAGEFVGTQALANILEQLRERADLVLIDAPPLLSVGDSLALSARVDALLVLTRLKVARRGTISELHRALEVSPAAKLGFVVTGAESEEEYGYGYGSYYQAHSRSEERSVAR